LAATVTEIAIFMIGMPCAIRCQVGEDDQDDPCTPHGKLFELVEDELPDVAEEVRKQLKEFPGRFLQTPNHPMQKRVGNDGILEIKLPCKQNLNCRQKSDKSPRE